MAEPGTLARPYARAAFAAAVEDDALGGWSAMLAVLAAVAGEPRVRAAVADPARPPAAGAETLTALCAEALDRKGRNLVRLLAENRRLPLLPWIAEQFERLRAEREGTAEVEVSAAFEIGPEAAAALVRALKARLGREVRLETRVDRSLIGGAVVRAGDTVIDGSVRGRLARLGRSMNIQTEDGSGKPTWNN